MGKVWGGGGAKKRVGEGGLDLVRVGRPLRRFRSVSVAGLALIPKVS